MKNLIILSLFAALPLVAQDADAAKNDSARQQEHGNREAHRQRLIEHFDKDGDGKLNDEEKAAMQQFLEQRRKNRGERRGGPRPSREEMIQRFDKDGDGELNEEERKNMREELRRRRHERKGEGRQNAAGQQNGKEAQ